MKLAGVITTGVLALILGIAVPVHAQEQRGGQDEGKPAQQEDKARQEDKKVQEEKPKQEEKNAQQANAGQHAEHGRIPQDRFQANFGREHVFVINRPVIIEGQPRFQYGGYWFGFGELWPTGWSYGDNVYVDYVDGGYYLYNPVHPGIRIVVNVL